MAAIPAVGATQDSTQVPQRMQVIMAPAIRPSHRQPKVLSAQELERKRFEDSLDAAGRQGGVVTVRSAADSVMLKDLGFIPSSVLGWQPYITSDSLVAFDASWPIQVERMKKPPNLLGLHRTPRDKPMLDHDQVSVHPLAVDSTNSSDSLRH